MRPAAAPHIVIRVGLDRPATDAIDQKEATMLTAPALDALTHPWVAEGARRVRFGVSSPPVLDRGAIREFAQTVEGLGFDSLWMPDHPMATGNATWTALAARASATRALRLGTLVACAAYWNPVVLARAAADIDRLSGGRFTLGLGSGDAPWEFAQLGLPFPPTLERQAALEETLRIVRPLLRGETVTYQSTRYQIEGALLEPRPLQEPWVPILVAGGGERTTLRWAAEYGDACNLGAASWAGGAFSAAAAQHKFAILQQHCVEVGRADAAVLRTGLLVASLAESSSAARAKLNNLPPQLIAFMEQLPVVGTPEEAASRVRAMLDVGFQYVIFVVFPFDAETLRLLAERVLPAVTADESGTRTAPRGANR
jgi:alkanesulfonate monooxygenase SsuD/methylene tetrahydromethanopterin reductase-like flavin-dependent oxidoreductase (luciferase family)